MLTSSGNHKSFHLKLQPYKQNSVALRRNLKLSSKFFGPYTILKRVGQVAYELELPQGSKIHPVFHVSLLKKTVNSDVAVDPVLPVTTEDGLFQLRPFSIVDNRVFKRGGESVQQFLVCWGEEKSNLFSWEDEKYLRKVYPELNPWGQGCGNGGGIVVGMDTCVNCGRDSKESPVVEEMDGGGVAIGAKD